MPNVFPDAASDIRLDDLYRMTAYIYSEQNAGRSPESTFLHFTEVCGMLSGLDRNKPRGEVDFTDALCKSLGWFFPLCAQFRVQSLEKLVFRKYPRVCPYCRSSPHADGDCKSTVGLQPGVLNHDRLRQLYAEGYSQRPSSLDEWQAMFQAIYPRTNEDRTGRSTLGLLEEIGELAEAIRVFERHPVYLAGEIADVFSYLMGVANEFRLRHARETQTSFSFEAEFLTRYPGMCTDCGYSVCRCPHVPDATIGRMAKELELDDQEHIFSVGIRGPELDQEARSVSTRVLERIGGYPGLLRRFPLDRGQANRDIVDVTLGLAEALKDDYPEYSESLYRNALKLRKATSEPGERRHNPEAAQVLDALQALFKKPEVTRHLEDAKLNGDSLARAALPSTLRVLIVVASPATEEALRSDQELRIIRDAIARAKYRERFELLPPVVAARIDDLRRALLDDTVNILHFAGHGDDKGILLEDEAGDAMPWSYAVLAEYLKRFESIRCVVLNACYGGSQLVAPLCGHTIAMEEELDDPAAIEFARGFYDALGAGRDFAFAAKEGELTAKAKGHVGLTVQTLGPGFEA